MRITNILIKLVGALALLALTFSCTDDTYDVLVVCLDSYNSSV